jgi:hypothetical protein
VFAAGLDPVRAALLRGEVSAELGVVAMRAERPVEPWHGIGLRTTNPTTIDVRLFGQLSWLVTFRVALPHDLQGLSYRIDLDTGAEIFSDDVVVSSPG